LHLLKGKPEAFGQISLAETRKFPAHADAAAEMDINGIGGFDGLTVEGHKSSPARLLAAGMRHIEQNYLYADTQAGRDTGIKPSGRKEIYN
jgi:hypothetical protein